LYKNRNNFIQKLSSNFDTKNFNKKIKMKLFGAFLVAAVAAEDKNVPPRTPIDRLDQLRRHIGR